MHRAASEAHVLEARRLYAELVHDLGTANGLFRDSDGNYAKAWPFSQTLAAAIANAKLPEPGSDRIEVRRLLNLLPSYYDGAAYEPYANSPNRAGTEFFDDNEWLALDLVDASRLLDDRPLLAQAQQVFHWVTAGWDASSTDTCSGGVYWAKSATIRDRNTVSTANGAVLALELYLDTGNAADLGWGERMYGWVQSCLADSDGLFFDHIDPVGRIDPAKWAYNQGAMVAAAALLYRATGRTSYLEQASSLANTSLRHFAANGYAGQPAIFVAIFFRYLGLFDAIRPAPQIEAALSHYVAANESAAPSSGSEVLDRAAAVQLMAELAPG